MKKNRLDLDTLNARLDTLCLRFVKEHCQPLATTAAAIHVQ